MDSSRAGGGPGGLRLSRRELLALGAAGGLALLLSGCGGSGGPASDGSSLESTWEGEAGTLEAGPGAPLLARTELAPAADLGDPLATLAHLTDAHVLDAASPARVPFLARLGSPFTSTFRPHEALTARVLDGAAAAVRALGPDAVIQGGDLIDNAQANELDWALRILAGGRVGPSSGGHRYRGVQSASDPDPFYYRPDIDAPRHPGLLAQATASFAAGGLGAPWYPVLGDHDLLVQGVLRPTSLTDAIARRDRAVWDLPEDLTLPETADNLSAAAPDGLPDPELLEPLIRQLSSAPSVAVTADPERRELGASEVVARLRRAAKVGGREGFLDYSFDVGSRVRVIVLDLVRRSGGSDGVVHAGQADFVARELRRAGERWVVLVSHQPLVSSPGGESILALLDRHPRVAAALFGHTHANRIEPRKGSGGGYWLIGTASLIDYPQQSRALRLRATAGGGIAIETWMLDHVPAALGNISRELAYLYFQGGRPKGFAGKPKDRNVTLYRPSPGG